MNLRDALRPLLLFLALALVSGADSGVLVVRPNQPLFQQAAASLAAELGSGFQIDTVVLGEEDPSPALSSALARGPRAVVALDNRAIGLVRQHLPTGGPPVLAGLALNLDEDHPEGLMGVAYEVAPFTLVTRFQAATDCRVRAVLMPYRGAAFRHQAEAAVRQLERAGIRVVAKDLAAHGEDPQRLAWMLERHLADWVAEEGIDAVIVPSDNLLVNRRTLPIWTRVARRSLKPFLTGVEAFVTPRLAFCVYAAAPDPTGIGQQLAQQILHLVEGGAHEPLGIEPPVQVLTRIDPAQAERLGLRLRELPAESP